MGKSIFYVAPKTLLFLAGLVWMAAGGNIFRIGMIDFAAVWHHNYFYLLGAVFVFFIFMGMIFYRLVQKHHARIMEMLQERVPVYHFFDRKSYLIMIFMMTGGLLLRKARLLPRGAIGILYCGIGAALMGAGLLFFQKFFVSGKAAKEEKESPS